MRESVWENILSERCIKSRKEVNYYCPLNWLPGAVQWTHSTYIKANKHYIYLSEKSSIQGLTAPIELCWSVPRAMKKTAHYRSSKLAAAKKNCTQSAPNDNSRVAILPILNLGLLNI